MLNGTMLLGRWFIVAGVKVLRACLLYYCAVLPLSYLIDQRKILFLSKCESLVRSITLSVF